MKKLKLIGMLALVIFTFTGCFSKTELEDFAYVIAIGVDKGSEDNYIVSFQVAVPIKIAGEGSTGSGKESTSIVSLETDTLFNSISRADTMMSKEITLSHNKIIVISEEVAKEGIEKLLNAFVTSREIRPKTSVIVYKGLAKDLLANLEPILEKNPSRYYDLLLDSNQYTGYAIDNTLFDFYISSKDMLSSPYALLTEPVREEESSIDIPSRSEENPDSTPEKRTSISNNSDSNDKNNEKQSNQLASNTLSNEIQNNNLQANTTSNISGDTTQNNQNEIKEATGESQNNQVPSNDNSNDSQNNQATPNKNLNDPQNNQTSTNEGSNDSQSENLEKNNSSSESQDKPKTANKAGIAIFTNDKLVGEIKNEQILSHVMLLGELKKVNIDIEDIEDKNKNTVIKIRQTEQPQIDVEIDGNTPKINILIRLECDLITSGSQIDYTDEENKHRLSEAIKNKLTKDMNIYLTKISKDFKADPIGFGKHYRKKILTLKEIEELKWSEIFPNSEFNINFQLHLDTTQMVSNQIS